MANPESVLYFVSYVTVVYLTLLNFLLALIIGSYDKVKTAIYECKVENSFFDDVLRCIEYRVYRAVWHWPARIKIVEALEAVSVGKSRSGHEPVDLGLFSRLVHPDTNKPLFAKTSVAKDVYAHFLRRFPQIEYKFEEADDFELKHNTILKEVTDLAAQRAKRTPDQLLELELDRIAELNELDRHALPSPRATKRPSGSAAFGIDDEAEAPDGPAGGPASSPTGEPPLAQAPRLFALAEQLRERTEHVGRDLDEREEVCLSNAAPPAWARELLHEVRQLREAVGRTTKTRVPAQETVAVTRLCDPSCGPGQGPLGPNGIAL